MNFSIYNLPDGVLPRLTQRMATTNCYHLTDGISEVLRSSVGCFMHSLCRIGVLRLSWPGMRQQGLIMYRTLRSSSRMFHASPRHATDRSS